MCAEIACLLWQKAVKAAKKKEKIGLKGNCITTGCKQIPYGISSMPKMPGRREWVGEQRGMGGI
jgi:hypothetical protein